MLREHQLLACCAQAYSHPLTRWLLGDSLHPGGLALTSRLAHLVGIKPSSRVLDAGSGLGATAIHLAKSIGCRVVGITPEEEGIQAGYELAQSHGLQSRVTFLRGDLLEADLEADSFDVVLMECVLSILPRKEEAVRRLKRVLRPGGRLGLTDVTVNGPLPDDLQGVLAVAGCVADARPLEGYVGVLKDEGFVVDRRQDLPTTAAGFLSDITGKLLMAEVAGKLGKLPIDERLLAEAQRVLTGTRELVRQGTLSYGLVIAHKPE